MTGFTFGQSGQTTTAVVHPLNTGNGFSLGGPAQTTASSGTMQPFSFGQSSGASPGFALGQTSGASTGFSLGQSTGASIGFPLGQTSGVSTGFSLGQTPGASTGFPLGQTPGASTGFPHGQTPGASTGFPLGQTPGASTGFPLGQTPGASTGFPLGQTPGASTGFPLGQTPGASTGFLLGQTPGASTGFAFSQQPTSSAATGLFGQSPAPATGMFGQTSTSTTSALNFGLQSSASGSSLTGLGTLNTATPSATGFGGGGLFGQTTSASTSGGFAQTSFSSGTGSLIGSTGMTTVAGSGLFGITNPNSSSTTSIHGQTTPISSIGGLFGTSLASTSTPGNLFGQTSTGQLSQAQTQGFFNTTSTSPGFNLNLSSQAPAPSSIPSLGLGGSLPTSLAPASVAGLGGFQPAAIDAGVGSSTSKSDGKCVKEAPLPLDIFNTMIIFENYKDTEKKASEENIRQTAAPFHKLIDDTKKLRQHVIQLSNQHAQLHASARKLKTSVIQEAEGVEMARRTQDTPMSLQGDNKSPEQFFLRLVRSFEERMTYCRNKIDEVEKCSQTNGGLSKITSEDMKEVLKKEHEMVKVLAAKVYTLHNQLINHCCKSNNPSLPQPEALFKPVSNHMESIGISHKDSSILRPCLGEGGSGLLNFQSGQQRAKAVSLGAAPPTLPLGQPTSSGILGSTAQSGLFGSSSGGTFPFNNSSLNFGAGSYQSSPTAFGTPNANVSSGLFGNTSLGNSSIGAFGLSNNSTFGSPKAFGKSSSDHDESQRKRRM